MGLNTVSHATMRHARSGGVLVFVDQAAEDLCSPYHATGRGGANCANVSWRSLLERAMRSVSVVVRRVLGQHCTSCRSWKISIRSRHSRRTVLTHRSA